MKPIETWCRLFCVMLLALPGCAGCNETSGDADTAPIADLAVVDLPPAVDLSPQVTESGADAGPWTCPTFAVAQTAGVVDEAQIDETSGMAVSRKNAGVLWIHNDSGDLARLYAISTQGKLIGVYRLAGIAPQDWEDMAAGPGPTPGEHYLYVGDIGDNSETRSSVQIQRVPEPTVAPTSPPTAVVDLSGVDTIQLTYPDGAHNAETLMVDPASADIYVVTKNSAGSSRVYRAPAPHAAGSTVMPQLVATLQLGSAALPGDALATGGDITPAGDEVLIRTYTGAFLWHWPAGATLAQALQSTACPLSLSLEPQGETVGFAADGSGFYTLSEKTKQPLYFYRRE